MRSGGGEERAGLGLDRHESIEVGQNAGGDHQRKHMHADQQCRGDGEE